MNYWVAGATWGADDLAEDFYRRGYWEMGWDDEEKPQYAKLRDSIQPSDRIAVKKRDGQGASTITIKAIGIVKEVYHGRVYVDWILTRVDRQVPCRNYLGTLHGPLQNEDPWVRDAFCL